MPHEPGHRVTKKSDEQVNQILGSLIGDPNQIATQSGSGFSLYLETLSDGTTRITPTPSSRNYIKLPDRGYYSDGKGGFMPIAVDEATVFGGFGKDTKYTRRQQKTANRLLELGYTHKEVFDDPDSTVYIGKPGERKPSRSLFKKLDSIEGAIARTGGGMFDEDLNYEVPYASPEEKEAFEQSIRGATREAAKAMVALPVGGVMDAASWPQRYIVNPAIGGITGKDVNYEPMAYTRMFLGENPGEGFLAPSEGLGIENFWGGLLVDMALDPLTYLGGVGAAKSPFLAALRGGTKAGVKKSPSLIKNLDPALVKNLLNPDDVLKMNVRAADDVVGAADDVVRAADDPDLIGRPLTVSAPPSAYDIANTSSTIDDLIDGVGTRLQYGRRTERGFTLDESYDIGQKFFDNLRNLTPDGGDIQRYIPDELLNADPRVRADVAEALDDFLEEYITLAPNATVDVADQIADAVKAIEKGNVKSLFPNLPDEIAAGVTKQGRDLGTYKFNPLDSSEDMITYQLYDGAGIPIDGTGVQLYRWDKTKPWDMSISVPVGQDSKTTFKLLQAVTDQVKVGERFTASLSSDSYPLFLRLVDRSNAVKFTGDIDYKFLNPIGRRGTGEVEKGILGLTAEQTQTLLNHQLTPSQAEDFLKIINRNLPDGLKAKVATNPHSTINLTKGVSPDDIITDPNIAQGYFGIKLPVPEVERVAERTSKAFLRRGGYIVKKKRKKGYSVKKR